MSKKRKAGGFEPSPKSVVSKGAAASRGGVSGGISGRGRSADNAEEYTTGASPWLAGLLIFLIASPAIFAPYGQGKGYAPSLHIAAYIQTGATLLLSLFLLSVLFRKRVKIVVPRAPLLLPLSLFYAWAMLSVLWADEKHHAVTVALNWSGAFVGGLLALLLLRGVKRIRALLFFVSLSGLLIALLGIGQYLLGVDWVQQGIVPAATFGNKNMAAQYGVLVFPLAVTSFLYCKTKPEAWFFAVVASFVAVYIFYTRSRGALTGLLVEAVVLAGLSAYLRHKHDRRFFADVPAKRVASAASLLLFLGAAYVTPAMLGNAGEVTKNSLTRWPPPLLYEHGGEALEDILEYEGSAGQRFTTWGNSTAMFKDHYLIGVGLGSWTNHYAAYQSRFKPDEALAGGQRHRNAHNDYLEILCELGVVGFALFVWAVVSLLRLSRESLVSPGDERLSFMLPFLAAIAGIAVSASFSFPFKHPMHIFMLMVYLAVLSGLYGDLKKRNYVLAISSFPAKGAAAAAAVFAAVVTFNLQRDWYESKNHYRNAELSLGKRDYRNAVAEARRAHELSPLDVSPLRLQASALLAAGREELYRPAVEMLARVARVYPHSADTFLSLARAYYLSGRYEDAVESVERLEELQPTNLPLRYRYSFLLLETGYFEEALKRLELQHRRRLALQEMRTQQLRLATGKEEVEDIKRRLRQRAAALAEVEEWIERAKLGIQERDSASPAAESRP